MHKVSLYIPCFNAEPFIASCLDSILAQTYPIAEILVINDGSTDRSMDIVQKYPQVTIIEHEGNRGLGIARNTALQNAQYDFLANIDSDCIAEPDWLEKLMAQFKEDKIAGVGGRLFETNKDTIPDYWRVIHMRQDWGDQRMINPPWLYGHSVVFRRSVLLEEGGYLEKFRTNYEDLNLSFRLLEKGYKLIYEPGAVVNHLRTDTSYSVIRTRWRWTALGVHGPVTCGEILKNQGRNIARMLKYAGQDIIKRRFALLGLDFALGFYSVYADIRSLICQKL